MGAPIGPGDWVECVDVSPEWNGSPPPLALGAVYCVREVCLGIDFRTDEVTVGFRLDRDNPRFAHGWVSDRFRPIYRPKADLIERLKAPPQRVGEPA